MIDDLRTWLDKARADAGRLPYHEWMKRYGHLVIDKCEALEEALLSLMDDVENIVSDSEKWLSWQMAESALRGPGGGEGG